MLRYKAMGPQVALSGLPESFSALDRLLVEKTETALLDGLQLERWCRDPERQIVEFPLQLKKEFALPNRPFGYFGEVEISGRRESAMGARQIVELGRASGSHPAEQLRDFVFGVFLPKAHWVYADGFPGGFTIEQSLYRDASGKYNRFEGESCSGCVDWRKLGSEYSWTLLTVQIHDFVMQFGPYRKRFKEAACVAMHADFVHVIESPEKGYQLEVSVGYPFVEYAPIPNHFGFGPGKFGTAVKLYSFLLTDTNRIEVRMEFAAAPRCRKVFDFGRRIPDPVYGGARLLHHLTLGLWKSQPFHDKVDTGMLCQHARVHQALMDGVAKVWDQWVAGGFA